MAARLTRDAQINATLPLALAHGWSVREFASRAHVGFSEAARLLRVEGQRAATGMSSELASISEPLAVQLRESVVTGAQTLLERVRELAGRVETPIEAERLARSLETVARLADSLSGLTHLRSMQRDLVRSGERIRESGASSSVRMIDPFLSQVPS
jgi:hypothetical protein